MREHQLILQWPVSSPEGYDAVIAIEDRLLDSLPGSDDVDGHDVGSGTMNVFIWTDDAPAAFERVRSLLSGDPLWSEVRAAYLTRAAFEDDGDDAYRVLWPAGLETFELM